MKTCPRHPDAVRTATGRCRGCLKTAKKKWERANPDKVAAQYRRWQQTYPERAKAVASRWYGNPENRVKQAARMALWRKENPGRIAMYTGKRRAIVKRAAPKWLTEDERQRIFDIYREAREISVLSGIEHHVDHVVPLCGRRVCGLHVPWNLRIITAEENHRKNRHFQS